MNKINNRFIFIRLQNKQKILMLSVYPLEKVDQCSI